MPSSKTAARCSPRSCNSIKGTPISLLRLPWVANQRRCPFCSPNARAKIAAIICVVVVLPLLPVTDISASENCARQHAATRPRPNRVSATISCGTATGSSCSTISATAPRWHASRANSWPSKRGPRNATYRAPACNVRVSVDTSANSVVASPTIRQASPCSESARAVCDMVIMARPPRARAKHGAPPHSRKTAAAGPESPGIARGPCRR